MKVLAVEGSTEQASLALLLDGTVVATEAVAGGRRRSQGLFVGVETLLSRAEWTLEDVEAFAVGRGPGAYTGLRVSLTAVQGWALPGHKPVWTVSSAAAVAAEWFAEQPTPGPVVVSGSARRDTIWAAVFEPQAGGGGCRTSDWKLLAAEARGGEWPDLPWVDPRRVPQAEWVGRLYGTGLASEACQPIYLHPAVAIAPRFAADGRPVPEGA
ncbi:MAG: tRNA (adenosine(37)-N6)-threonylcarbamoyltransferase complex dimerization subunit type 1 TsaB [Kiritimatiellae bacterium]|nr:tRNA (adenosine(37)-N6)-threonylcarbamoyltransferase complex dimerization subunit type 1 TsaB [Kiritimatiellia bacterium]